MLWITNNFQKNERALNNSLSLALWSGSCSVMSESLQHHGLYTPWDSPGQNTRVSSLSLLQGIFPNRELNQFSLIAGGFIISWVTRKAQEYRSEQLIPSPGDCPNLGIELGSPALKVDSLPTELSGNLQLWDLRNPSAITELLYVILFQFNNIEAVTIQTHSSASYSKFYLL